jgi:dUTP diphosphatase
VKLRVVRLDERARLPTRAHVEDAGLDLYALDPVALEPGERASVGTGVALEIPSGHAGLVLPRSGLAARHGISVVNAPGLIDAGYRGEVRVLLLNNDPRDRFEADAGARIAQLVVIRVELAVPTDVEALAASDRGHGGFGSSGS